MFCIDPRASKMSVQLGTEDLDSRGRYTLKMFENSSELIKCLTKNRWRLGSNAGPIKFSLCFKRDGYTVHYSRPLPLLMNGNEGVGE